MIETEFYSSITKWQTGIDMINHQNCFGINFGYNGEMPIPTINLKIDNSQDLKKYDFETSYTCYFVFVDGKHVEEMITIVDIVEYISEQFHGIKPIAMLVIGKFTTLKISEFSQIGKEITKVVLRIKHTLNL